LANGVDMVYTAACGSRSDTGENRPVPRENLLKQKKLEWIILIGWLRATPIDSSTRRKEKLG
jgi:hypothetical protein